MKLSESNTVKELRQAYNDLVDKYVSHPRVQAKHEGVYKYHAMQVSIDEEIDEQGFLNEACELLLHDIYEASKVA